MAVRSREKWQELLNGYKAEKVMLAIAFEDASPAGYMLYSLDAGTFKVQELLTLSHEAQTALLRYAAGHLSDAANLNGWQNQAIWRILILPEVHTAAV